VVRDAALAREANAERWRGNLTAILARVPNIGRGRIPQLDPAGARDGCARCDYFSARHVVAHRDLLESNLRIGARLG
jgi:hypothetical protein